MKRNILLIGGAGYIGLKVAGMLLQKGLPVRSLDYGIYNNLVHTAQFLGNPNFSFIYGDLCNEEILDISLKGITDVVVLAGLVGDPVTYKYPNESKVINDQGIINCLKNLNGKKLNQVIFISTCSNYGLIPDGALADENFPLSPLSSYAKSKVNAEKFILENKGVFDFHPTILRFATAFGLAPRMRFDLTVNEFTKCLTMGNKLDVFDADTWRPYCHVNDFAQLIYKVLGSKISNISYEVFNAGGDKNNYTKRGIINLILKYLPEMKEKISYLNNGNDPRNYKVDFQKVKKILGYEPAYSVENGIVEIISAVKNNVFNDFVDKKNIYGNYEVFYKGQQ